VKEFRQTGRTWGKTMSFQRTGIPISRCSQSILSVERSRNEPVRERKAGVPRASIGPHSTNLDLPKRRHCEQVCDSEELAPQHRSGTKAMESSTRCAYFCCHTSYLTQLAAPSDLDRVHCSKVTLECWASKHERIWAWVDRDFEQS
jgi:hypothetical protein